MMHTDGILAAIGHTPLIRLRRLFEGIDFHLYAKLEALNPAGSAKDRPAFEILRNAWDDGAVTADTVVVESSSGNMGIGLAQACRCFGIRFRCVVDPRTAPQNLRILEAYGAEVDMVEEPDPESGEFLQARLKRVQWHLDHDEHAFWPNQYANQNNAGAHYRTTMAEIDAALDGKVDWLFCATSTCGTIRGCCEYAREHGLRTHMVAVDATGSVIFGGEKGRRLIPGLGAGIVPDLCEPAWIDDVLYVDDLDCIVGCRRLLDREAVFAGGSSGGVASAVAALKDRIPAGASCVMILPDRGERYLDTVFSDDWVKERFGAAQYLRVFETTAREPNMVLEASA